jgi:hypothetical protein
MNQPFLVLCKQFGIVLKCSFSLRLLLTFKVYAFANHEISRFDDNLKYSEYGRKLAIKVSNLIRLDEIYSVEIK